MTPRQKAKDIYSDMLNAGRGITSDYLAGECALIAVQYMLSTFELCNKKEFIFYKKVKAELKKILNCK